MKGAIVICFLGLVAVALARPDGAKYTSKYDNINLDEILGNERLFRPYVQCLLGEIKKCTAEGKELKSHLREALENDCANCTDAQRKGAERVIAFLIKHQPEAWKKLMAEYDPTGKYVKSHEAELKKLNA